jgi:hypothetical protein
VTCVRQAAAIQQEQFNTLWHYAAAVPADVAA